jgi:hypothetical protein
MISKKVLIPVFIIAAVGVGAMFRVSLAQAAINSPQSGLIQYLAQKLGVDQTKVETAFNDYRSQEQANRQQKMTETYTAYLDGLVKQGKLTDTQKIAILAKHTELQKARESADWSSKTPEDRRTQMAKDKTDIEAWAKEQGIDISYLRFDFGSGRGGKGMSRGGMTRGQF